jgi:large subunit ribosomal protein L7/L12
MANIDTLVKELGQLTVLEALDLAKKLSKEWNIDLDALQTAPAQVAEVVVEESTTATIMLTGFAPGKKIPIIKAVRPMLDLGLLEAKNFVEDLPKVVKEDIEKEEAEKFKKILEEAGGTVELK